MNQIAKMAAFVQHNMPQNAPDTLTPQEAYDVAAFVHSKPHTTLRDERPHVGPLTGPRVGFVCECDEVRAALYFTPPKPYSA